MNNSSTSVWQQYVHFKAIFIFVALCIAGCSKQDETSHLPRIKGGVYRSLDGVDVVELGSNGTAVLTRGGIEITGTVLQEGNRTTILLDQGQDSLEYIKNQGLRASTGRQYVAESQYREQQQLMQWEKERIELIKRSEASRKSAMAEMNKLRNQP